jgi:hypothetical protein
VKKFEKPVVALNEMMMSESIASICCYAKTTTGSEWGVQNTIVTVLNGGTIGSTGGSHYSIATGVLRALGGVLPAPQVHYSYFQYVEPGEDVTGNSNVGGTEASYGAAPKFYTEIKGVVTYSRAWEKAAPGDGIAVSAVSYWKDGEVKPATVGDWDYVHPTSGAQICTHTTSDCPWAEKMGETSSGMHIGATTAHATGGQKWWEPHKAQQYAS